MKIFLKFLLSPSKKVWPLPSFYTKTNAINDPLPECYASMSTVNISDNTMNLAEVKSG